MVDVEIKFTWNDRDFSFFMRLDPEQQTDKDFNRQIERFAVCEPELAFFMLRALRVGDVFVDGGANMGFFSILAQRVGAQVIAFEPAQENLLRISENLSVNHIDNVFVRSEALWSDKGEMRFVHDQHPGKCTLGTAEKPIFAEMVQTTALNYMSPTPRVIKLDIEGAEEQALRGATTHLTDQACPFIVAEMNMLAMKTLDSTQYSLRKFMLDYDYDTFLLHKDGSYPSFIPFDVIIEPEILNCNILFSTPAKVREIWPRSPIT